MRGIIYLYGNISTLTLVAARRRRPLLRLLIADLVGQQVTRESIATLREAIADLQARIAETEAAAESLPHRRKYLLLVTGHLRRLLDLHLEFVDEVERELAG
jgi:hypothetical protein